MCPTKLNVKPKIQLLPICSLFDYKKQDRQCNVKKLNLKPKIHLLSICKKSQYKNSHDAQNVYNDSFKNLKTQKIFKIFLKIKSVKIKPFLAHFPRNARCHRWTYPVHLSRCF